MESKAIFGHIKQSCKSPIWIRVASSTRFQPATIRFILFASSLRPPLSVSSRQFSMPVNANVVLLAMSVDKLPNEILLEILSYFNWSELLDLTLVSRRWNDVIGERASLTISKSNHEVDHPQVTCIPLDVLCSSSREYRKFSCVLCSVSPKMMRKRSGAFRLALEYCHQRWNINTLQIISRYRHFMVFLQHYKHFLNEVVRLDIIVHDCVYYKSESSFRVGTRVLTMENLRELNLFYESRFLCFLKLHAPNLSSYLVDRSLIRSKVHLKFYNSTQLRSMVISNMTDSHVLRTDGDPVELKSLLPQAPSRLEMIRCSIATTFSAMFGNLQAIILNSVTLTPTDEPLKCLKLKKLEFSDVTLEKPLKLRVPQLHTLICDSHTLRSVHLQDVFSADRLAIRMFREDFVDRATVPAYLSRFRTLHLWLWHHPRVDIAASWLWRCVSGITELKLQSNDKRRHCRMPTNIWQHFPRLNSLRLHGTRIPDNLNCLPTNVEVVTIEEGSTRGRIIEFPPSVERVEIHKMCILTEYPSNDGMILVALSQYPPIKIAIVPAEHYSNAIQDDLLN